jgi:hypothetical protein
VRQLLIFIVVLFWSSSWPSDFEWVRSKDSTNIKGRVYGLAAGRVLYETPTRQDWISSGWFLQSVYNSGTHLDSLFSYRISNQVSYFPPHPTKIQRYKSTNDRWSITIPKHFEIFLDTHSHLYDMSQANPERPREYRLYQGRLCIDQFDSTQIKIYAEALSIEPLAGARICLEIKTGGIVHIENHRGYAWVGHEVFNLDILIETGRLFRAAPGQVIEESLLTKILEKQGLSYFSGRWAVAEPIEPSAWGILATGKFWMALIFFGGVVGTGVLVSD